MVLVSPTLQEIGGICLPTVAAARRWLEEMTTRLPSMRATYSAEQWRKLPQALKDLCDGAHVLDDARRLEGARSYLAEEGVRRRDNLQVERGRLEAVLEIRRARAAMMAMMGEDADEEILAAVRDAV
jgi:hypothetical protein